MACNFVPVANSLKQKSPHSVKKNFFIVLPIAQGGKLY